MKSENIIVATRGSALALTQTNMVVDQCREAFPHLSFEVKVIKTTGDKLQTLALAASTQPVTKGLFTKELETALLKGEADFAVHSLKDLPTELPGGLALGAVSKRAEVRDVLIYRDAEWIKQETAATPGKHPVGRGMKHHATVRDFPSGATIATSSTRRQAQLLALRPDLKLIPIRGNVGTRLKKLAEESELDGLVLAGAGLQRLGFKISAAGELHGEGTPPGLNAVYLSLDEMLPCVGQGALGIETRLNDPKVAAICEHLNDPHTHACVTAERAFLHAMGGGCLSPVAAYGEVSGDRLRVRAVSFRDEKVQCGERIGALAEAAELGRQLAEQLH